ncbi:hypothetical protein GIS00_13415 [Nakamurella sp. YIM 132087]|uniref:Uncharacterized protein n=1 Tax=Nakamurella alba TaxID=2665158 RepID=A0A7K1FLF9_9ACTN|nr:hypothetical protein [Nakamurella alba]MTD14938.1 hypothetical protein [Nakamurella alba]
MTASGNGYTLSVTYPRIARAGLDVPFRVEVTAPEPFPSDQSITVRITREYLTIFESQGLHPETSAERGDATTVDWEFDPPADGAVFAVDYDTYIQPGSQRGEDGTVQLVVDGAVQTSVSFTTTLLP